MLESADTSVRVTVDHHPCANPACALILQNGLGYLSNTATRRRGRLLWITNTELRAEWADGEAREENFMFRVPAGITAWIIVRRKPTPADTDPHATRVLGLVNRWRDEILARTRDTGIAEWAGPLLAHASALRAAGNADAARAVLRRLAVGLVAPPMDPAARLELAELEDDPGIARAHARLVLEQAEDQALLERAARLAGISPPTPASLPTLAAEPDIAGPQLVLIALPPADPRLLVDAARAYERATGIPTRLVRLAAPIAFDPPERFLGQRQVEQDIARRRRQTMDFTGWDRARYARELRAVTSHEDAITRFMYDRAGEVLLDRPEQFRADPVVTRLGTALAGLRARDRRVMYVAVTSANLFRDDALFLFSLVRQGTGAVGLLSYSMMLARSSEETDQSRPRLVERLAKELVPASLLQLDIPRPEDPTDPYAEAPSLQRLDAKTLTLSTPTRTAIETIRSQTP